MSSGDCPAEREIPVVPQTKVRADQIKRGNRKPRKCERAPISLDIVLSHVCSLVILTRLKTLLLTFFVTGDRLSQQERIH